MIIAPANRYGIDKQIYLIQTYLESELEDVWAGSRKVYGRAIDTIKGDDTYLEVYDSGNDYKQLFVNDKTDCIVGFKVNERQMDNHRLKAEIDIIFTVNVKRVQNDTTYLDEKTIMQAVKILRSCGLIENVQAITTGIEDVFTGYNIDSIKHRDMSPFHVFSITSNIEYNAELC